MALAVRRQSRTGPGLLPEAAHLVLPRGIASDSFPSTQAVCERIGIIFDPWQRDLNRCLLAKSRSGLYAADTALLSIPRQVGKTFDVGGVVFADSIKNPGTTTVWTAHRFKVARETFNEMRAWARTEPLAPHIDYDDITTGAGNESIPFRNGSRIVFAARERGAIRGFTKVRRLVLDEAQILTEMALADLVPTMNQAVNPQIVLMCTPPKPTDPGEVVTRLRSEALAGESEGVLYVEISAPRGSRPDDRAAWRKANPSYPKRTPAKAILRMRKLLNPEDFMREALGVWDDPGGAWDVIPEDAWGSAALAGARM
jgi:phage terminase large subunit-like protein